ncbi:hypothetical protein GYMLUDRAFT_86934 [Collybiopsis luxurians FD-317 M1]|uniref:Unplaced genomic scaffold GYMLUscaffold_44, whole genome shotgun sequence n=1 Tax=Collybiopsis luxurians FD-317 M1 TaxID=944289 RepID=A0A0D0CG98_9AGAR|nr:hypothetical protein GYMLUDRAFT_86934 [Collybiopsis luxurians FD-317 M1]
MPHDSDRDFSPRSCRAAHGDSRSRDDRKDYKRSYDDGPSRRGDRGDRESSYRRSEEGRYGYGEQERERERRRDRERYDRDGERYRDRDSRRSSRRRSESPRSRNLSRSRSRSRSKSPVNKAKPNFGASGLLAAETNTVKSVDGKNSTVLKYNEPPEARKPVLGWRLYVFKGEEQVELLHIQRQSAYLIGRDRLVADIPVEHPSCSKQHAVIQHRLIQEKDEFGGSKGVVKPFIIDLESTNGTHVNDDKIPPSRYYELKMNDVIKFGTSNREYVLLHDDAS